MSMKVPPYHVIIPIFTLLIILLFITLLLCGCGQKPQDLPDPTVITLIEASATTPNNTDFDSAVLTGEDRVHAYAFLRQNFGSVAFPQYISDYFDVGDLSHYTSQNQLQLEFYWYGYLDSQPYETITFTYDPASSYDKNIPLITIASSCADTNAIIYQSISAIDANYSIDPQLSPGYTVETFYRDQFQELVDNSQVPKEVVDFDTPVDADYIVKACFKLTLRD